MKERKGKKRERRTDVKMMERRIKEMTLEEKKSQSKRRRKGQKLRSRKKLRGRKDKTSRKGTTGKKQR